MASRRAPATREDHDDFCTNESWQLVRGARGKPVQHHRTYTLAIWDGRILRTRISKPVDGTEYAPSMWAHILREQLEVSAAQFWACARERVVPDRGAPSPPARRHEAIPLHLVRALLDAGVAEADVLRLDGPAAAADLLRERYSGG